MFRLTCKNFSGGTPRPPLRDLSKYKYQYNILAVIRGAAGLRHKSQNVRNINLDTLRVW
jgi:hypothetical protein